MAVFRGSGLVMTSNNQYLSNRTPWRRGRNVTWDVTVADTFAASYVGDTAVRAGAAAERAAAKKAEKYVR